MSMNKPACRKFANQPLHIRPNDGLLYASQVEWLVTTAVRTIDHHRTLFYNLLSFTNYIISLRVEITCYNRIHNLIPSVS